MSLTRILRKLLTRSGSRGGSRVTAGLSSVGPPPTLMMIQLFDSATGGHGSGEDHPAAEYFGVEAPRPLDIIGNDEVPRPGPGRCCSSWPPLVKVLPRRVFGAQRACCAALV